MSIKICTPLYKHGCELPQMRAAVASTGLVWESCTGPHIWRNRNKLVSGGYSHYLFWDADIVPENPVAAISELLARKQLIVGAAYEQRRDDGRRSYCGARNADGHIGLSTTGIHWVDWVGAGFLLVAAPVFEVLPKPWFRHEFIEDDQTPEDIGFCMNARAHGITPFVDCNVVVEHHL